MTDIQEVLGRNRVMWGGTIGFLRTVREVIDGAAAGGYHHVSLSTQDIRALGEDGLFGLRDYAAELDVRVSMIDGFYPWLPLEGTKLDGTVCSLDDMLHQAEVLGARIIGALAIKVPLSIDDMCERFAPVCAPVADAGFEITIEFSPLGGIADLAAANALVTAADNPCAGILFDTWHFYRGNPDWDLLDQMNSTKIKTVQISDAATEIVGSLWKDTLHSRLQPGDGSFDLVRVVAKLEELGVLDWYGPEVISDELAAMTPGAAGEYSARRLDEFLTGMFPAG